MKPIIVVGAGPVGLVTALGLDFYDLPFELFEDDDVLSSDTKAGTILTRSLDAFRRYGVADGVLARALRLDEIGEIERATNKSLLSVQTDSLMEETRYPFLVNLPQHHLEPVLADALRERQARAVHLRHRLTSFEQTDDGVIAHFETPEGPFAVEGSYLLACDGGRSTVRGLLDIPVEGVSLDVRMMLVDLDVDLDVKNPRDYPYLAYFADPREWMILVRQPHCWRFLFPLPPGEDAPTPEQLRDKARHFVGDVDRMEVLNTVFYRVHHRIASQWQQGRVFLMGDAAHLITPMWALGLNTGVLDALSLPWRLAWVSRGWAGPALLEGYAREQRPLSVHGTAEMAEAARAFMEGERSGRTGMTDDAWNNAMTRTLLGVRLDVDGASPCSLVRTGGVQLRVGDRLPDALLHGPDGRPVRLHDLVDDHFLALYLTDVRRRPSIPAATPGVRHFVVSRWDAPLDSGLRDRTLFDVGGRFAGRAAVGDNVVILVRPDDHIAAIVPMQPDIVAKLLSRILA